MGVDGASSSALEAFNLPPFEKRRKLFLPSFDFRREERNYGTTVT
jgi:hypothetical protein